MEISSGYSLSEDIYLQPPSLAPWPQSRAQVGLKFKNFAWKQPKASDFHIKGSETRRHATHIRFKPFSTWKHAIWLHFRTVFPNGSPISEWSFRMGAPFQNGASEREPHFRTVFPNGSPISELYFRVGAQFQNMTSEWEPNFRI